MTQAEVAIKLGKPQSFMSKIESGERQLYFFETRDLCLACNTDWAKFLMELEKKLDAKP